MIILNIAETDCSCFGIGGIIDVNILKFVLKGDYNYESIF